MAKVGEGGGEGQAIPLDGVGTILLKFEPALPLTYLCVIGLQFPHLQSVASNSGLPVLLRGFNGMGPNNPERDPVHVGA